MSTSTDANGITYHKTSSAYPLPNHSDEHKRLERQTAAIDTMMSGQRTQAQLHEPKKILEIGSGTGAITTHLGQKYPTAQVYGMDLSPVPAVHEKPSNVQYIQGNFFELVKAPSPTNPLVPGTFDYVFHRMLMVAISDWPGYVRTCMDLLQPGGTLEMQDLSYTLFDINNKDLSSQMPWLQRIVQGGLRVGLDFAGTDHMARVMQEAGFQDVQEAKYPWTWSVESWEQHPESDDIGRYTVETLIDTLIVMAGKIVGGLPDATPEELESMKVRMKKDLNGPKGTHMVFRVVRGRKPL